MARPLKDIDPKQVELLAKCGCPATRRERALVAGSR